MAHSTLPNRFHPLLVILVAVLMVLAAVEVATARKAARCSAGKQSVPGWGCVARKEVAKAKRTCAALKPPAKFTGCLCEDSGHVGACGD